MPSAVPSLATPPAELEKLAGYGKDIAKNRAEAKRLLKEAGVNGPMEGRAERMASRIIAPMPIAAAASDERARVLPRKVSEA